MSTLNSFLDYDYAMDSFIWKGTLNELERFIKNVLNVDTNEANSELKEDKKHNAFSLKVKNSSVRFYTTTGTLKVYGSDQGLMENLHEICERNKSSTTSPLPSSTTSEPHGGHEPSPSTTRKSIENDSAFNHLIKGAAIESESELLKLILENIVKLKEDIAELRRYNLCAKNTDLPSKDTIDQGKRELDDLKDQVRTQLTYIKQLEEEKEGLVIAIKVLTNTISTKSEIHQSNSKANECITIEPNKTKKSKKKQKIRKPDKTKQENSQSIEVVKNGDDTQDINEDTNHKERKTTVIAGDSIISKLNGWKMSDKSNKIVIKPFPGSKVDDMKDYIKPSLKRKPKNFIIHTGTNDLKSENPLTVAENIISLSEFIEKEYPETQLAISLLTTRQDSPDLEKKRLAVNKEIRSFARTRDLNIISHDNIDSTCLNERKLHLNIKGTLSLAKNFKKYVNNLN